MGRYKHLLLLTIASFMAWGCCSPVQAAEDEYGTLNPNAAEETAQFGFLVGRWHAEFSAQRPDGSMTTGTADWRISYILDGHALQDRWSFSDSEGNLLGYGTMFRTFDAEKGHWTIVEQTTWRPSFHHMTAKKVSETMVMYEKNETPEGTVHLRRVFYNIEKDRFDWRSDLSRDGGKTWQEGVAHMVCSRVK